jgi:uncharacterized protein (DUF2141 family)
MSGRFFLIISLFSLIIACAKISSPSGGPRDRKLPVTIKSMPAYGALNFKGSNIAITFDEYVVLDNIAEKFMVSPPVKKKPRVFLKGKNVEVEFYEQLKDSTTYTLYFQDAIKDLNEGNVLLNYQFVFSTGAVIDSLSVTGNVFNAFNLNVPEKTLALMYRELADSAVKKHLPEYITRVNQDGYFRIDNIRPGNYRLYALKDVDNSKNYNLRDEEFAFLNSPVLVSSDKNFIRVVKDTVKVKSVLSKVPGKAPGSPVANKDVIKVPEPPIQNGEYQLILFTATKKAHYFTGSSRSQKYLLTYTLSLPPDSMKFRFSIPGVSESSYFMNESRNRDTIKVWLTDSTLYTKPEISTIINYPFTDTLGRLGYKEDTIKMRFLTPRAPRVAKVQTPVFTVETNITASLLKPGQMIILKSQTPFNNPDTSRMHLYELKDSTRLKVPYNLVKDSTNSCKYFFNATLIQGKKYFLLANPATFGNIYNEYSDSIGIKFSVRDPDSYNKMTLNITNYVGERIIQLLNSTEKVISEAQMKSDGKLVFQLLEPGAYRIRVIYDLNGNGKWDTGDFDSGLQPEPVSYYPQELEIKTGWDIEQPWDIGILNFKDPKLRDKMKTP